MLGHKLMQEWRGRFDVWTSLRSGFSSVERYGIFEKEKTITSVSAENFDSVVHALAVSKPDVVVNAIGVIKQLPSAKQHTSSITLNSLFPHRLSELCRAAGSRMITFSTDCVFNGKKGNYRETDLPDAEDLYGRTKFLGEVGGEGNLTVRSSIIGRELNSAHSLVEWFLSNRGGRVRGFTNAIYSGFPTVVMAEILADLIEKQPNLHGVWQISSQPINKYELIKLINESFDAKIEIEPFDDFYCDRSLDSSRFRAETGFKPPSWHEMIERMANDPTPYEDWR